MRASDTVCGHVFEAIYATQLLMTRPRDEWRHDVTSRYRALEQFSKEDARLQFLRILRSLPYGTLLPDCFAYRFGVRSYGQQVVPYIV